MSSGRETATARIFAPAWLTTWPMSYLSSIRGFTISARCPAISARRRRRISSSLLPLNIGPQTTSSQPPARGCVLITRGSVVAPPDGTTGALPWPLLEQPREAPVLQRSPGGLAARAVVDRVLLEVDARDRRPVARARPAELVVDSVGLGVAGACKPQLEPARHLFADRGRQARGFRLVELRRERVRGKPRRPEDLVRPGAADAGDQPLVAQQRVQPPRIGGEDARDVLVRHRVGLGAEVRQLVADLVRPQQPDARALLRPGLGQLQLAPVREPHAEHRRLRALTAGGHVPQPACAHQMDHHDELAVVRRQEEALRAPLDTAEALAVERRERRLDRLQRRDVRRPRALDRELPDEWVQLAAPRLHLRQLGHDGSVRRRRRRPTLAVVAGAGNRSLRLRFGGAADPRPRAAG